MDEKQIERFWSKVNIEGEDDCWEWTRYRDKDGYGVVGIGTKKIHKAHRVAYMLFNGDFPANLCCHSCDNPPCCNPKHLFNGTQKDNMEDCKNKGRISGENNSSAKLTAEQVIKIREEYKCPAPRQSNINELALKYDVSYQTIHDIISRRTWKDI